VGSRERKRAELRRRKQRAAQRPPVGAAPETGAPAPPEPEPREDFAERMGRRSEERNAEARAKLEPLAEGERPLVVTIGAGVSALLALSVIFGAVIGLEVNGEKANAVQVIVPVLLMGAMAWGMWRARYWAVLGFMTVMLILILVCSLGLVTATAVPQAIGNAAVVAIAGTLFFFTIKALARIQMPQSGRPG
jgi:hypothetical protein